MIKHFIYSKSDQSKTIKGSWIFCCALSILQPFVKKKFELIRFVRTYVFHMLGSYVTILCNWLIL